MQTKLEKTLSMRLSYVLGELYDKYNEYEAEAERNSKGGFKHIRRFYADDVRKLIARLQREIQDINYIEVE